MRHNNPLVWTSHLAFVTRPIRPTNRVNVAAWRGCGTWERALQLVEVDRPIIRVSVNATLKPPCTNRGVSHSPYREIPCCDCLMGTGLYTRQAIPTDVLCDMCAWQIEDSP